MEAYLYDVGHGPLVLELLDVRPLLKRLQARSIRLKRLYTLVVTHHVADELQLVGVLTRKRFRGVKVFLHQRCDVFLCDEDVTKLAH